MDYSKTKIVELNLNDVLPNRFQPRIKFNEISIIELSESIKEHGVLQPILVRPIGDKFEIIAGERRYKGAVLAGLDTIPAMIVDSNDKDSAEIALIENVQRQDLNPIEEAISYKKILDMGYLTQEQLASKLGMSQSTIANKKRLLNLSDEVQEALMEDKISERHARSLLKISDNNDQKELLKIVISKRLTVRKLDEEINKILDGDKSIFNEIIEEKKPIIEDLPKVEEKKVDEQEEDEIIDISDLFEDIDFSKINFEEDIKEDKLVETTEKSKEIIEEKKETDDMNNNRFFNTIDNSMDNNLGGLGNSLNTPIQPQTNSNPSSSSMFSNLMSPNSNNNEMIDSDSFRNFLDPTYVDGNRDNAPATTNNLNNNVFSKFMETEDNTSSGGNSMSSLLAPQSDSTSTSNISGMLSSQTKSANINDLLSPMGSVSKPEETPISTIGETNFNDVIKAQSSQTMNTESSFKPDLLAPMPSNPAPKMEEPVANNDRMNDLLTPDLSINREPEPFRPIEETPVPVENVPVFVTASTPTNDFTMPSNPIIDNPNLSSLLSPQPAPVEPEPVVEEEVEEDPITPIYTPENQARIDLINSTNPQMGELTSSTIIVEDTEKLYDPILPTTVVSKEPQVDFRTVINMIRDLNDKIEGMGFAIDTDEYDLDDVYQVVFKIVKK